MKYQQHIDGLRAIAVLAVVGDHLGFGVVSGGYVGVDVFFVISGYLITSIVMSEIDAGRFSFRTFYERRVRRIFPALIVVIAAVWAAAYALVLPSELVEVSGSAVASLLSVANVWFWAKVGYFDADAGEKPLLHMWSLGVEEQFYLLYPVLLLLLSRRLRARLPLILWASVAVLAVIAAAWTMLDTASAFYLLPARAWELGLGGALALTPRMPRFPVAALTAVGVAGIFGPIFLYGHDTLFPGLAAVPVCLGTAALILLRDQPNALAYRALSWSPVAFIGKISYSLYLWHWPVIVFQQNFNVLRLPDMAMGRWGFYSIRLAELAAAFVLAVLSYYLVERPFRSAGGPTRWMRWGPIAAGTAVVLGATGLSVATAGFEGRFDPKVREMERYLSYDETNFFRTGTCFIEKGSEDLSAFKAAGCVTPKGGVPNVLVYGDSHAAHLWFGLKQQMPEAHVMQATAIGCRPLIGAHDNRFPACGAMSKLVYDQLLLEGRIDLLVLAGRWLQDDLPGLDRTLAALHARGIKTLVVGPTVEYTTALPRLLAREMMNKDDEATKGLIESRFAMDREMAALAGRHHTPYFSIIDSLCEGGRCKRDLGGVPMAFDYGHLTPEASEYVGALIGRQAQQSLLLPRTAGHADGVAAVSNPAS